MVYSRRESFTHHINHMKFLNVDTAIMVAISLAFAVPIMATIWADLDAKEVSSKNDEMNVIFVAREGRTQRLRTLIPLKH